MGKIKNFFKKVFKKKLIALRSQVKKQKNKQISIKQIR